LFIFILLSTMPVLADGFINSFSKLSIYKRYFNRFIS